jgi:sugar lactone lactonase YvrE
VQLAAAALAGALAVGCVWFARRPTEGAISHRSAPEPSAVERYCGWFGSARGGVLYFGEAAFWSALHASGGDPSADLRAPGPQRIGRFDLERRALLTPLEVGAPGARSGVWDLLAHADGRIYFTTFFELSGSVDLATGEVRRFESAGTGLNELADGPDGSILVTRYGGRDGGDGSLVRLDAEGEVIEELPLAPVEGRTVAAKSVAWDPARDEYWVNTDLLPPGPGPVRHDARVLDRAGREIARIADPELQFFAFRPDGVGLVAEADAGGLWLRVLRPGDAGEPATRGTRFLADEFFDREHDFAQDVQLDEDGRAVVTRWSGRLHVVELDLPLARTIQLPHGGGLFYTGVLHGERLCATLCRGVEVVCREGAGFERW